MEFYKFRFIVGDLASRDLVCWNLVSRDLVSGGLVTLVTETGQLWRFETIKIGPEQAGSATKMAVHLQVGQIS